MGHSGSSTPAEDGGEERTGDGLAVASVLCGAGLHAVDANGFGGGIFSRAFVFLRKPPKFFLVVLRISSIFLYLFSEPIFSPIHPPINIYLFPTCAD